MEYPWRWLVNLEFLEVQVLDEIYVGQNGGVRYISRLDGFQGETDLFGG